MAHPVGFVPASRGQKQLNRAPRVQEALLLGDLHLSERRIRALASGAEWEGQRQDLASF